MGFLQKIGELYFSTIERLSGDANRSFSKSRRSVGLQAGAVGVAMQASGIKAEGMKPEEALDLLGVLKDKMTDVTRAQWDIERIADFLDAQNKTLIHNIANTSRGGVGYENFTSFIKHVGGSKDFDPTTDVRPQWFDTAERHRKSLKDSFSELVNLHGASPVVSHSSTTLP